MYVITRTICGQLLYACYFGNGWTPERLSAARFDTKREAELFTDTTPIAVRIERY